MLHNAVELTRQLIAIPSVNPMGKIVSEELYSGRKIAGFIADYLNKLGVDAEVFGTDPEHPNVLAFINAGKTETVLLEAHMDTVSHEQMRIDPFDPVIGNGRLYGRGSCDTKANIAIYLDCITRIIKGNVPISKNILLAFVKDEEYSFSGARELIDKGINADFAIVGEPTELNIIHAHKGLTRFFIHTRGTSCHASMPWLGDSAILAMGRVLHEIEIYSKELENAPHPALGFATINVGKISGGQTVNTVPGSCTIEIDHRLLPGMNFDTVKAAMKKVIKSSDLLFDDPYLLAMGIFNEPDAPHCKLLQQACRKNGTEPEFSTAHYATDASVIQHYGIPCVVFGPGSIAQAHTADEYILIEEIEKASAIILSLLTD